MKRIKEIYEKKSKQIFEREREFNQLNVCIGILEIERPNRECLKQFERYKFSEIRIKRESLLKKMD